MEAEGCRVKKVWVRVPLETKIGCKIESEWLAVKRGKTFEGWVVVTAR